MRASIYKPVQSMNGKLAEGPRGVVLVASNVPVRIDSKSEVSSSVPGLGSSNIDQIDTTDVCRMPDAVPADDDSGNINPGDGWLLNITSGQGESTGDWYTFQGAAKPLVFKAGTRTYLVKQAIKPVII